MFCCLLGFTLFTIGVDAQKYITYKDNGDTVVYTNQDIRHDPPIPFLVDGLLCIYFDETGDTLRMIMTIKQKMLEGKKLTFYRNGMLATISNYKKDKKDGYFYYFDEGGALFSIEVYRKDKLLREKNYDIH